jgi:hypothetical protein
MIVFEKEMLQEGDKVYSKRYEQVYVIEEIINEELFKVKGTALLYRREDLMKVPDVDLSAMQREG